ncbi:MAG: recombinase family protein, partial [Tannerellaceae bacterium]
MEALIIAYGEGRNGKSTFWNVIERVLGSYSGNISADMLTVGCRRNVKPGMAKLYQFCLKKCCHSKNENGNMVVVNEEAIIVKEIFTKALAGVGTHAIAKELNARNVKTKKGGNWSAGTVNAIIKNEKYTGDVIFQKTYTDSSFKRHINYGEQDQYLCEDHHEAIVSYDIFNKANDMLLQRGKEKGNTGGTDKYQKRYSFSGKIKCGVCGSTFKRRIHYKPSGSYIAWCCNKHIDDKDACSMKYITDDGIKLAFATMANKLIFSRQLILKPLMNNLQGLEDKDRLADIADCERKLEKNIEQRQVLTSLMASSLLETGVFNQENSALLQEYEKLQAEKENLLYSISGDRTRFDALDNLIKAVSKREMLRSFEDE